MQVVPFSREIMQRWFCWALAGGFLSHPGAYRKCCSALGACQSAPGQAETRARRAGAQLGKCLSLRDGKNIMWCSAYCRQQFSWFSGY